MSEIHYAAARPSGFYAVAGRDEPEVARWDAEARVWHFIGQDAAVADADVHPLGAVELPDPCGVAGDGFAQLQARLRHIGESLGCAIVAGHAPADSLAICAYMAAHITDHMHDSRGALNSLVLALSAMANSAESGE